MKAQILFLATMLFVRCITAQPLSKSLPPATFIIPYHLEIGFNTTTVLVFPAAVKPGDKGKSDKEFIAQKQFGMENILKLKAARKDFTSSNLHVFTSDGRIYAFDVSYSEHPEHYTFDLAKISTDSSDSQFNSAVVKVSGVPFNDAQILAMDSKIKKAKPFLSISNRKFEMKLKLQAIYSCGGLTFFNFQIKNKSDLGYPIDFIRLYIQDEKKVKRTTVQSNEIVPVFRDTATYVDGGQKINYVVAVPRFTIPEHKRFKIEMYEINGGRNISLAIKNKALLRAKNL